MEKISPFKIKPNHNWLPVLQKVYFVITGNNIRVKKTNIPKQQDSTFEGLPSKYYSGNQEDLCYMGY